MEPVIVGILGFAVLLILIFLGLPVGISMLIPALLGLFYLEGIQATYAIITSETFRYATDFQFTAMPMFLIMGYIAMASGLAGKGFDSARIWLSGLPGGLGMATAVASGLFGAACGSGNASTAALSRICIPEMLRHNYDRRLAAGSVAAATTVGVLIPPSIIMVIYAVFTEVSLGRLILAGYIPGVLTVIMYMIMIGIRVSLNPKLAPPVLDKITWKTRLVVVKDVWGILVLAVVLLGGIYSGLLTATEAAAASAFAAFVLMFIIGKFKWPIIKEAFSEALRVTAMAFVLMLGAIIFSVFMAVSQLPTSLTNLIVNANLSAVHLVIITLILFGFLGCFMPSISLLLLTMPVLLPALKSLNVDLIWFGILYIKMVEVGAITPPFGLSVYVLKGVVGDEIPMEDIFRGIGWFVVLDILIVAILLAFPQISLWLPNTMVQ